MSGVFEIQREPSTRQNTETLQENYNCSNRLDKAPYVRSCTPSLSSFTLKRRRILTRNGSKTDHIILALPIVRFMNILKVRANIDRRMPNPYLYGIPAVNGTYDSGFI